MICASSSHLAAPDVLAKPVHVFVPYSISNNELISPYFETAEMRHDVRSWMAACKREWSWVQVTSSNIEDVIQAACHADATVFNLCDGDEINGYPGLTVVQALEAVGLSFTGARAPFYALSTSKLAMKRCFELAGVATAPFVVIKDIDRDIDIAAREIGFPLFIKPDVSFGSAGLTVRSLARSPNEAKSAARELFTGMHDCCFPPGGIFAEPYLDGQEFTVLCVSDPLAPQGVRVLTPAERIFHPSLPNDERFLTFERICGEYSHDVELAQDVELYSYAPADPSQRQMLIALARHAYQSVEGSGYARVDIRTFQASGEAYVLEVNANCALSSDDTSSVGGLLAMSNLSAGDLIALILRDGESRER